MEGYRDGDGSLLRLQLHDSMTAALAYRDKTVPFKDF